MERKAMSTSPEKPGNYAAALLNATGDAAFLIDAAGKVLAANEEVARRLGLDGQTMIGDDIYSYLPPEVAARRREWVDRVARSGRPLTEEDVRGDRVIRNSLYPVFDDAGNVTAVAVYGRDVTDRRKKEEQVELLARMLDDAPAAVTVHDNDGRFLFSNRQNMLMHGYDTEEEFLSIGLHELDVPESQALVAERFRRIAERGEARFEVAHYRRDGSTFPLEVTAKAIEWHGRPAVLSIAVDITERRRAEAALRESEERFQRILSLIPDMVSIHDTEMNILYSNWNGFGAVPEERRILQSKCYRTYRGFDRVCPDCRALAVLESGEAFGCEAELPDGKWYDIRIIPVLDDSGGVEAFVEWVRDITERKRAEEVLERSRAELKAVYDSAPMMLCVVDRKRRVMYANPAFRAFAAIDGDALQGALACGVLGCVTARKNPGGCGSGSECTDCSLLKALDDTLATGAKHTGIERRLTLARDGTREEVVLLGATVAVRGAQGNNALLCLTDITEQHALTEQLSQARKMESVGRLAGGVAHDFNNFLMGIMGYAELCRNAIDADHPASEWLDEITRQAERSANLTQQLLAFARRQTVAPIVLDFNRVVGNMLRMLRRLIGEDIDLDWRPGDGLWPVRIDPGQVDQILANLCVNARDAISGVGRVTIESENVSLDAEYCRAHACLNPGDYVMLAVSDDGCGMDRETMESVFEPFFTTKSSEKGTGLGLATVYGIAKQNDGFVNVYSEPGEGSIFKVYLPRFVGEVGEEQADSGRPVDPGGTETVLLVEDEEAIRSTMRPLLEDLGYTVLAAEGPGAALRTAAEHGSGIDLLITDVVMPEMSGRDLAERLLADFGSMKVLYMSGYTANVIAHRGILEEGMHFMSKPFGRDELARKVREVLSDRR
jgi:PAS domain S-box-containing protein